MFSITYVQFRAPPIYTVGCIPNPGLYTKPHSSPWPHSSDLSLHILHFNLSLYLSISPLTSLLSFILSLILLPFSHSSSLNLLHSSSLLSFLLTLFFSSSLRPTRSQLISPPSPLTPSLSLFLSTHYSGVEREKTHIWNCKCRIFCKGLPELRHISLLLQKCPFSLPLHRPLKPRDWLPTLWSPITL